jgi:hypothetical protein
MLPLNALNPLKDIYGLLNLFERQSSYLTASGQHILHLIDQALAAHNISRVDQLIKSLLTMDGTPRGTLGFAETYLVCGWSHYQAGNLAEAVIYLTDACAYYLSFDHQFMIAQWMLGLVLVTRKDPDDEFEAIRAWQRSLKTIEKILNRRDLPTNRMKMYTSWRQNLVNIINSTV